MKEESDEWYDSVLPPNRGPKHEALAIFLGEWKAQGTSYGKTQQPLDDPKGSGVLWTSTHTGRWYTGEFFLIQDEQARPGGEVFDTLSVLGVDPQTGKYFARSFENHGFYRHYEVTVESQVWTFQANTNGPASNFGGHPDNNHACLSYI